VASGKCFPARLNFLASLLGGLVWRHTGQPPDAVCSCPIARGGPRLLRRSRQQLGNSHMVELCGAGGPRKLARRRSKAGTSRSQHSQITSAFHPARPKARRVERSRARLPSSLFCQKARRADGIDLPFRHEWRCQKHPWTKMTLHWAENAKSGHPGSVLTWVEKR